MKRNVCLQSTLRQPVRTLFLLVLIGLISFAFIARAAEYLVINRETHRLAGHYRAIGFLESENVANYDVSAGAALVTQSHYVDFEERQRHCSGVLQGVYNADLDGFTSDFLYNIYRDPGYKRSTSGIYISDILVYGELISRSPTGYMTLTDEWFEYQFILRVDQVVAGYPEYFQQGQYIRLRGIPERPDDLGAVYDTFKPGKRYLVRGYYNPTYNYSNVIGSRWLSAYSHLILKPLSESGLWFLPVEPGTSADFSDSALVELSEELRVLDENQHAMSVLGTKDMSALPAMQESSRQYFLEEGRWLDREDDLSSNRVCVVHQDFAEVRGLAMGDTITLKLRDLKAPRYGYIVPGEDWGAWQDYETHTEEFEIVGLYGMISPNASQPTAYSTYMYIPDSCMPAGYGSTRGGIYQGGYSFVLHSLGDTDAFLAENSEELAALGLRATIMDNGWESFKASSGSMRQSAALNAVIFALVLLLALALSAFLYQRQRRRDFAILRSLGVPSGIAIGQMLQPMAMIGAVGILIGGFSSWHYALGQAAETLASLAGPQGVEPSAALSIVWLVGLILGVFSLLLLFTGVGALITARHPVLELLQDTAARTRKKTAATAVQVPEGGASLTKAKALTLSLGQAPSGTKNPGLSQAARYVLRHIRRAPLKSMLTVAVALCFTLALGWMSWTIERNESELDQLYRSIQVEAEIVKSNAAIPVHGSSFIRRWTVDNIMKRGFVQSAYLEAGSLALQVSAVGGGSVRSDSFKDSPVGLRAFDQPEQFFSTKGQDLTVEYAAGWNESFFTKTGRQGAASPVLLPAEMMARLGLNLGDIIQIQSSMSRGAGSFVVAGQYVGSVEGNDPSPILLPISALHILEENRSLYDVAKFVMDPERNRELLGFQAEMDKLFYQMDVGLISLTFVLRDQELTQAVEPLEKNLSLMSILYPVTVAVSTLIAAGLAALFMLQAAKEAAIMRVLGTTKIRARVMLCGEQLALCLAGLLLGLTLLIILRQDVFAVLAGPALVCAALYLAGTVCGTLPSGIAVTNRMPLELLQVKE